MEKKRLFGMTIEELRNAVTELAMPKFTATQIADWIYKKGELLSSAIDELMVSQNNGVWGKIKDDLYL